MSAKGEIEQTLQAIAEKFSYSLRSPILHTPAKLAPTYVYLASDDSSFVTGQVLHVNGGVMTET